ncbi:hypothetical protein ACFGVR_06110 [Mucilaginibacter sp. AW1-3]
MKKANLIFIFLFAFADVFAQQGVIFKMRYLPDLTYTCTQTINSLTQIDFTGDKTELEKLPVMQLPIVLQNKNSLKYTLKTGKPDFQKNFSGIVQYLYASTKQLMNGEEIAGVDSLKGKNFAGIFLNNVFRLDDVKNAQIPDSLRNLVSGMINSVQIIFPDKALKPGDSFTQDVPMQMPVSGKPVTVNTRVVYKLISTKNNGAFFDVTQTAVFKTHTDNGDMEITGTGDGHIFYDMQHHFFRLYQNTLTLKFTIPTGKLTMSGTSTILSAYQTEISTQ